MAKKYKINRAFTFEGQRYYIHADTEEEFLEKKINKIRDLKDGRVVLSGSTTVKAWAEECIKTYKTNVSERGLRDMRNRLKNHVYPDIGNIPIRSVKPVQCQRILNDMSGMSSSMIDKVYMDLRFIFKKAKSNKLIVSDPSEDLVKPNGSSGERRSITDHEREHFLKVCEKFPKTFILFEIIYYCGLRPSEAIRCIGKDIEVIDGDPMLHVRGTKTDNAERYVPIPLAFYAKIKNTPPFSPIAPSGDGTAINDGMYYRLSHRLKREMNISMGCRVYRNQLIPPFPLAEDFVPYDLRHTYCTDLARKGVDVRIAQKLMGHANIQMTADIYTHVDVSHLHEAAKIINAAVNE